MYRTLAIVFTTFLSLAACGVQSVEDAADLDVGTPDSAMGVDASTSPDASVSSTDATDTSVTDASNETDTAGTTGSDTTVDAADDTSPSTLADTAEPTESTDVSSTPDAGSTSGCGVPVSAGSQVWALGHDGRTREFHVHVPASYDASSPMPVVFDFHGRNMDASSQMLLSGMVDVAEREGFVAVHPEGVGQTFNGGLCCGTAQSEDVDDVGFTAAMIDALESELCIDSDRVYATGMSNGGFMAHRLGCELSDRIAAVAPVAGVLGMFSCNPERPVPVLHFHGTDDNIVWYDGYAGFVSVPETISQWRGANGCDGSASVTYQSGDVTCESWSGCDAGGAVELCTVDGGGHTWPGGADIFGVLGHTTNDIDATEAMWAFFESHTR